MMRWLRGMLGRRVVVRELSVAELAELGMMGEDSVMVRAVPYLVRSLVAAEVGLLAGREPCGSEELHRIRGKIQAFEQVERKWVELLEKARRRG